MERTLTYAQFLRAIKNYDAPDIEAFIADISKDYQLVPEFQNHITAHAGLYVISYPTNKYLYVNENLARIAGLSVSYIKANGIGKNEKVYYTPDSDVFDSKAFDDKMKYFEENVPVAERSQYRMSGSYRILNRKKELRNILQESTFMHSTPDGMPLISYGFVTDISHIRNDNRISSAVFCTGEPVPVYENVYYSYENKDKSALTSRHIEIIKHISDGKTSQEIADKLFISKKTVDNHRQKIREITNCCNSIELINYCRINRYVE